jgi:hypothetical protein
MKKLVSLIVALAMVLACCAALAEAPEGYPEVKEGIDFGGADIYIYDYWSGDVGSDAREENPTEEQAAQYAYRDWLNSTYNCHIVQKQKGDWGSQITEFTNFVSAPDGSYTMWIIEPGSVSAAMKNGYFAAWNNDLIDLSEDKWNAATSSRMTKDGKVYGVYTGATEPRGMLYFNKKLLENAGIDYNDIYDMQKDGTWTWEAFEDLCKKLTYDADNDGIYDYYGLVGSGDDFYMLAVVNNGGAMFGIDEEGKLAPTMNSPEALEALNWAKAMWTTYSAPAGEGANWDWYKNAWKQGYCAFYMYQGYGGFNDNSEMADMEDPWGAVMFPVGPSGDTYKHISSDNITVIPAVYDEETTAKLAFIYDMWTKPTPGFDDEFGWVGNKLNYTDERAVLETYAMMRENEHAVGNLCLNLGTQNDVLGQPLLWQLGGNDPQALIDENMPTWQALCDEFNQ